MKRFLDIYHSSLNKFGEELCGDQVRVAKTDRKTWVVLSDGLGSGVKANILATLTSQILITMLKEEIALNDVLETIIGTLPICQVRNIAYATFTLIEIDHEDFQFKVINFDNPRLFFLKSGGHIVKLEHLPLEAAGRKILVSEGKLEDGDFLAAISDGVWYAGLGQAFNFGWGWDNIANLMSEILKQQVKTTQTIVERVLEQTNILYGGEPGDDATLVGLYIRQRHSAFIFTGPPLREEDDAGHVKRLMAFEGRRIVCGGTTGNIVSKHLNQEIEVDLDTITVDVPPVGRMEGIHLMTEGILTIAKAMEFIREAEGDYTKLPTDINGATMLALEILYADEVNFLVGQQINPFYQNPHLPMSISIRKNIIEQLAHLLRGYNKDVTVEYC
ncbi:serine/threonine protein phosphatase [candidate division KSB3 bacterium]|uniref:Serine/threonine protein phosphatase n=1 Tax=candidate division KSB3 bacterium TaxID=2044937 RepID=A0A2G6EAT0_9BACT|nr:MAG: serine/threonine protein phosphatase [candidate division KSB3 bacterium]PIE30771.1 MAG: serine/threonine protein phosphatase [candidate division KSB3 bacterium]